MSGSLDARRTTYVYVRSVDPLLSLCTVDTQYIGIVAGRAQQLDSWGWTGICSGPDRVGPLSCCTLIGSGRGATD